MVRQRRRCAGNGSPLGETETIRPEDILPAKQPADMQRKVVTALLLGRPDDGCTWKRRDVSLATEDDLRATGFRWYTHDRKEPRRGICPRHRGWPG